MTFGRSNELGERRTRVFAALLGTCFMTWDKLLCFSASVTYQMWELSKENRCLGDSVFLSPA